MGFFRVKLVKGHEYFYWCKRVRSRKKSGGSGKVKSPDFLLGNHVINGKYLFFYLHTGDVPLREYAEAALTYLLKYWDVVADESKLKASDGVTVEIDWHTDPKVCLHTKDKRVDCRRKDWRGVREDLQLCLRDIHEKSKRVQFWIERAASQLAEHEECKKFAQAKRDELEEYLKNPAKTWSEWESEKDTETGQWQQREVRYIWKTEAETILDEVITECDSNASFWWEHYQTALKKVADCAPQRQQQRFRSTVINQVEKLVKDSKWLERHKNKD